MSSNSIFSKHWKETFWPFSKNFKTIEKFCSLKIGHCAITSKNDFFSFCFVFDSFDWNNESNLFSKTPKIRLKISQTKKFINSNKTKKLHPCIKLDPIIFFLSNQSPLCRIQFKKSTAAENCIWKSAEFKKRLRCWANFFIFLKISVWALCL